MKKKLLGSLLLGTCVMLGCAAPAMADSRKVVTLGADLTQEQKDTMMRYFGQDYNSVDIIYINNQDERAHLGSYVPLEQIGNYTYSCALVAPTSSGGIQVKTANLEWVTCNMIASTLSTSGVTNCQVVAACPFKVSGTGALTGVTMAYENASQQKLDPVKVDLANQELVTTGNLADSVGQSKATAVINEAKLEVIENNVTDIGEIHNIVNNVTNNYNVTINEDQSEEIAALMQQIAQQEYDITQLKATLERVQANVAGDAGASEEEQKEAEARAQAAEEAALVAAKQEQAEQQAQENPDGVVVVGDETEAEETENILENTDPSALEGQGVPVEEVDTTKTVQEQAEEQTETQTEAQTEKEGWGGWDILGNLFGGDKDETEAQTEAAAQTEPAGSVPAETENPGVEIVSPEDGNSGETAPAEGGDGAAEIIPEETAPAETEGSAENPVPGEGSTDAAMGEVMQSETEPLTEAQGPKAEDLSEEDRETYDTVEEGMETLFTGAVVVSEDGSTQVYLTEEAAKLFPEKLDRYVLNVIAKGADAVAAEEAADPQISQTILEETAAMAPDKNYEDDQLRQIDKYVRRLVFQDSEKFLADSQLEDYDKVVLYDAIMGVMEDAYDVEEPLPEETAAPEEMPAQEQAAAPEEVPADIPAEIPAEQEVMTEQAPVVEELPQAEGMEEIGGAADEFSDFVEETGTF